MAIPRRLPGRIGPATHARGVRAGTTGLNRFGNRLYSLLRRAESGTAPAWPLGWQPPQDWSPLAVVGLISAAIFGLAVLHASLRFWGVVTLSNLVQRLVIQLRRDVYDKLQRLSFRFFDANSSGSIINRVAGDVQAVRQFVDGVVLQVLTVVLSLAVYLGYMLSVHVPLTIACLATTPLLWIGAVLFSRSVRPEYLRNSELVDKLILTLSENVQGVQVVKGFGRQQEEIDKFVAANRAVMDQKKKIFRRLSIFQPGMGFLTQINMIVLLGYGGYLVVRGELALGAGLFVFANLLQQFANQVSQITNIANSIQASLTGAQRVFEVLDAPLEVQSPAKSTCPRAKPRTGAIRTRRFRLPHRCARPAEDFNFEASPGNASPWSGATGAGKSTLLSLIPRFYDAARGRVLIDGVDVRQLDLDDLRRNVGLVFQESFLFSNTVAANIAFGHPEATPRANRACRPHRRGRTNSLRNCPRATKRSSASTARNLSGGQRQRLAIARAMLLDPPILILDDAMAAVDPANGARNPGRHGKRHARPNHVCRGPSPQHAAPCRSCAGAGDRAASCNPGTPRRTDAPRWPLPRGRHAAIRRRGK